MKYIKSFTILILVILTLSCSEEFLDRKPISRISVNAFYEDESDIEIAVTGLYGTLQDIYNEYIFLTELPADDGYSPRGGNTGMDLLTYNPMGGLFQTHWRLAYNSIYSANKLLEVLPFIEFNSDEKKQLVEGEAYFIRALNYFNLVRWFGDVPLVTSVISTDEAREFLREDKELVYSQIINDLELAIENLPEKHSGNDVGRATKGAAQSLLGRVYLTRQNYSEVLSSLDNVIQSNNYSLLANFNDIFKPDNANHKESVFEIQYEGGNLGEGSGWSNSAHSRDLSSYFGIGTYDGLVPATDIINAFDETSLRYEGSLNSVVVKNDTYYHVVKHYMDLDVPNGSDDNWPLIRYADVILMYVEASNEINGPTTETIEMVNKIRRRAYGLAINTPDENVDLLPSQVASKDVFRETIWEERRLELAFEGHRMFDLVRTGRFVEVMTEAFNNAPSSEYPSKPVPEEYMTLFPIPQGEIDINPDITQNPGY